MAAVPRSLLLVAGCIYFPLVHFITRKLLARYYSETLTQAHIYVVALRVVSALQAVSACFAGFVIVSSCKDVLRDQHWLSTAYAWFGTPYFYYDTWAMYKAYWHKHPHIQVQPTLQAVKVFMKSQPIMMIHHLVFPIFYFPIVVWLRNGLGDFYVGCFYLIELAIPCISLRAVLLQFEREHTLLYAVNGIVLIVTFAVCRVLIFPFMFWKFGQQHQLYWYQVPQHIPRKCTIGCAAICALQIYWLSTMIQIAINTIKKHHLVADKSKVPVPISGAGELKYRRN